MLVLKKFATQNKNTESVPQKDKYYSNLMTKEKFLLCHLSQALPDITK